MTGTTVESLVRDSGAPLAAVELPSGRILAVNPPLAKLLGSSVDALTGSSSLDQLSPGDRHSAETGFAALADGHLTGYQAIRTRDIPGNPDQAFSVWVNTVDVGGTRVGLISVTPAAGRDGEPPALPPPTVRGLGDVVLGTVDGTWRIDRISQDVTAFLGITPEQCVGVPVLGAIHPSDAPGFLAAVEHARVGERSVALTVRLSAREPQWCEVSAVFAVISPEVPPPMAFALIRDGSGAGPDADGAARESRLEGHLLRIADELHAAGVLPRLQKLPTLSANPRLGLLTSREWAVLTRLLDGQRAAAIADDLVVSQSTVRNHLSSIYAKLRVDGQVDLIRTLRGETTSQ
jgi:DNA-binding CsgD family transcriptional regulator